VQDPFGRPVSLTNSGGIDTALRFPGQQADPDTGFAYNYFRDYDPTLGRYIQADPIGLAGGINRYAYVGGNPLGHSDFKGLDPNSSSSRIDWGSYTSWAPGNTPFDQAARKNFADWLYYLINPPQPKPWEWENACHVGRAEIDRLYSEALNDSVEARAKQCEDELEIDLATCEGMGRRDGASSYEVCRKQAMARYARCLQGSDIKPPLPPFGTK
jgi:RHS repeat-associated protein